MLKRSIGRWLCGAGLLVSLGAIGCGSSSAGGASSAPCDQAVAQLASCGIAEEVQSALAASCDPDKADQIAGTDCGTLVSSVSADGKGDGWLGWKKENEHCSYDFQCAGSLVCLDAACRQSIETCSFNGTVSNHHGEGLAGLTVELVALSQAETTPWFYMVATDANGAFHMDHVACQERILWVVQPAALGSASGGGDLLYDGSTEPDGKVDTRDARPRFITVAPLPPLQD